MCGKEFCNAYTELNDPFEQRLRFEEQVSFSVYDQKKEENIVLILESLK
jgi:lysyl-tRNA synthetase class II